MYVVTTAAKLNCYVCYRFCIRWNWTSSRRIHTDKPAYEPHTHVTSPPVPAPRVCNGLIYGDDEHEWATHIVYRSSRCNALVDLAVSRIVIFESCIHAMRYWKPANETKTGGHDILGFCILINLICAVLSRALTAVSQGFVALMCERLRPSSLDTTWRTSAHCSTRWHTHVIQEMQK